MGQGNGLEIQKYWSLGGLAWPRGARFSRLVAPSHKPSPSFTLVHPDVKIGKQRMRGWWTCRQDSGCSVCGHKLYLESVLCLLPEL